MPRVFVYGALMTHPYVLANGERASVPEHAVRFTARGAFVLEPAFAALEEAPGQTAWGVLTEFPPRLWQKIRKRELGYLERIVVAHTNDSRIESIALFSRDSFRIAERSPSARYAGLLLRGARAHELPEEVIERYRALHEAGSRWTLRIPLLRR